MSPALSAAVAVLAVGGPMVLAMHDKRGWGWLILAGIVACIGVAS